MAKDTPIDIEHPAALIVHWATGPVYCCIEHGTALVNIGRHMGAHVHASPYSGDQPCSNCVNEAKKSKKD